MLRIGICDDIREEVEKQEKQVRQITYQIGIRADIRKCYSGMDLLMEIELSGQFLIIVTILKMNFFRQPPLHSGKLGEGELLSKNIPLLLHFDNFISVHQAHIRPESTS